MAKSMVERYEQVLAQDPASTVFVELAKALIEKGDHPRAIQVCEQGLQHHPDSVVGRVLWGKALIHQGKPAQAMGQFDAAIEIDRENPHAYNLIGEVLLHKGLYRSALPILKKAIALQPNEGRVRQWFEQAQAALAGGPAPVLSEPTAVDAAPVGAPDGARESGASTSQSPPLGAGAIEPTAPTKRPALGEEVFARTQETRRPSLGEDVSGGAQDDRTQQTPRLDEGAEGRDRTEVHRIPSELADRGVGDAPEPTSLMGVAESVKRTVAGPDGADRARVRAESLPPEDPFEALLAGQRQALGEDEGERTIVASALPEPGAPRDTPPDAPAVPPGGSLPFSAGPGALAAARVKAPAPAPIIDPFEAMGTPLGGESETVSGLTSTFDALQSPDLPDPFGKVGSSAPVPEGDTVRGLTATFDALSDEARASLPSPGSPAPSPASSGGGLLPELSAPPPAAVSAPRRQQPPPPPQKRGLLDELPELAAPSHVEVPKVELSAQATRAMAEEFERELRDRIKSAPEKRSFLARHAVLSSVGAVLLIAAVAFVGIFVYTRAQNQGQDLQDTLAAAKKLIAQDTRASLGEALEALKQARAMDEENSEAWALTAYASALLAAEHGGAAEARASAASALEKVEGKEEQRGFTLVVKHLLAEGKQRDAAAKALLDAPLSWTEVHEAAGRILLARKANERALERFKQALSLSAANVRALTALGGYYQSAGDCRQALAVYETAHAISPAHPARTIGAAECRLEREEQLEASLEEMQAIAEEKDLPTSLWMRRELAYGQLLSRAGQHDAALKRLEAAAKSAKDRDADFQLALGQAHARKGDMAEAQKALENAFKLAPGVERVKEALARVLIDRDRADEALKRIEADEGERRVALVRGIAAARLKQWKRARAELAKTQVDGRFPAEAVIQLTLADAAEGKAEQAQEVLEKSLAATRKAKSEVRVALGQVYWQRGVLDKARAQFEEALKDDEGYEGACSLGRLLLSLGFPDVAIEPLRLAARRNGSHGEARDALGRALIATAKIDEGLVELEAWAKDHPDSSDAHRGHAFGLFHAGKMDEAEKAVARAVKLEWREPKSHRLQALVRFAQGDMQEAFKSLERANKLEGSAKDAETFCEIGHAFLRQGDSNKAQAAFDAALKFDGTAPCARVGQYAARLPAGARAAEKELVEIAEKSPFGWDKAFAQATLARVRLALGQVTKAREAADAAVKHSPHGALAHFALAAVAHRQKERELAEASYAKAVAMDGANAVFQLAYADYLSREGDTEKAVDRYETVLRLGAPVDDLPRVKKALPLLKKRLARRD